MESPWLETVATAIKDAPVVASAGLVVYGVNVSPILNGLILVAFAVWAVIRAVTVCLELKWKREDRNGKGK